MTTPAQPGPVIAMAEVVDSPTTSPRGGAAERGPSAMRGRILSSLVVATIGLLLATLLFSGSAWGWLIWIVVGLLAGAIAARARDVWIAPASVGIVVALDGMLGLTDRGPFWVLGAVIGVIGVGLGFIAGTGLGPTGGRTAGLGPTWSALSRPARLGLAGVSLLMLVVLLAYTTYVGVVGSDAFVHESNVTDCRTPMQRYGWRYEAIGYDLADDDRLVTANPDLLHCRDQGTKAADDVLTSDGIHLAGWYIPAENGAGPTGPTVLIVPGWKSNKSEVVKYAVPFHHDYNVVVMDLRNQGRSSVAETTLGLREQSDVEAMVDWVTRTKRPAWIGAMGNSMGAATTLAAAARDPRIRAVIIDSAHARLVTSIGNVLETERGHPSLPGAPAIVLGASLRVGGDVTSIDPVRMIARMGNRPVLLTHGTSDAVDRPEQSAEVNLHAALDVGVPVEIRYCAGAGHGAVIDHCPAEWGRWVLEFFAAAVART